MRVLTALLPGSNMIAMSAEKAVGAYLRTVRTGRGLTMMDVVTEVLRLDPESAPQSGQSYISKLELGKVSPSSKLVALINRAIGGNPLDVSRLLTNSAATAAMGEELAVQWLALSSEDRNLVLSLLDAAEPAEVLGVLKQMRGE